MANIIRIADYIVSTKQYLRKPLQPAIARLQDLIDKAEDKGLASSIYFREWLSYADAQQLLAQLRKRATAQECANPPSPGPAAP